MKIIKKYKIQTRLPDGQDSKFKKIVKIWQVKNPGEKLDIEYRVVVEDGGNLEMRGKIVVHKTAINCDVFLRYRVLLLGKSARAIAIPDLEILTNEVKAGHAASIGRVDEGQIFYLMSRGLSKAEAVELLVEAFLK